MNGGSGADQHKLRLAPLATKGLVDTSTGKQVSLEEAIRIGLLDTATGEFVDPNTGFRLTLAEAANKELIHPNFAELLSSSCGIFDPRSGRQISLLEAIDKGLFDPKTKSFVDPITGQPVSIENAVNLGFILQTKVSQLEEFTTMAPNYGKVCTLVEGLRSGIIDPATGTYDRKGKNLSLQRAISQGHVSTEGRVGCGLALSDAVAQDMIRAEDGRFQDRNTGRSFNIQEAVERGFINKDKYEIYDEKNGMRVTLENALKSGIINPEKGSYESSSRENPTLSLSQAAKLHLVQTPLSIKDCVDQGLITESTEQGVVKDPVSGADLTILEAVKKGILDSELKSVRDVKGGEYVNLAEAFGRGIVKPNGDFVNTATGEATSLAEAVHKGQLTSVSQRKIFDIEGIKNPVTGDYISFNDAIDLRIIDKSNSTFFDKKTMTRMTLNEAAEKEFIQNQLLDMLEKPIGISVLGNELTVLQAVMNHRLDPCSGLLLDPASGNTLPVEEAVQRNMITPLGAAVLKSLLNITVTTATVTQTVVRKTMTAAESGSFSVEEALAKGYVDDANGTFTEPESGRVMSITEAIALGFIQSGSYSSTAEMRRKSSTTSSVGGSSRKSSNVSSRSASPPKSLNSAKEFLKESSSRGGSRSSSLNTSVKKTSMSASSKHSSTNVSQHSSANISQHSSTNISKHSSVHSSVQGSRNGTPDKISRASSKSELNKTASGKSSKVGSPVAAASKKIDHVDSFEKRMEEHSEMFSSDSKYDYSFKSDATATTEYRTIPIQRCEDTPPKDVAKDGYSLKDAIEEGLLDPVTGIFKVPGTDKETSFQESLETYLVNGESAIIHHEGVDMTLLTACHNNILTATGHYKGSSIKEALEQGLISHITAEQTKTIGNIRFNASSGRYEMSIGTQPADLMAAIQDGKIQPDNILVEDPNSGQQEIILFILIHIQNYWRVLLLVEKLEAKSSSSEQISFSFKIK